MPLRCPRTRPVWNSNVVLLHDRPFAASQKLPGGLSKGVSKRNTSTGSEFFSISQCRGLDATKLVLLSHQFLYRDNLPLKLGNITDRNIISRASLRNVFHWLSSLFKGYKSALLNSKRDTGTEKTKTNKKKNKERYHLKWCQSFFVFFECISCSPTWTQCTTWMIICLMTSCKGPIAHL